MYITLNNEKIFFEQTGSGERKFLLIHNAGGEHRFFTSQMELLKELGEVFAIDLPGHGQSSANYQQYGISSYANLLIQFCAELNLQKINIIGLNNGANIALEIADYKPNLIEKLILLDPLLFMPASVVAEVEDFTRQLTQPNINHFIEQLIVALLPHVETHVKSMAENAFKNCNHQNLQSIFQDLILWNNTSHEKVQRLQVPTLSILSNEHHCSYQNLKSCNPQIEIGKVVFSGPWTTLEVSEQVNAMLLKFFARN